MIYLFAITYGLLAGYVVHLMLENQRLRKRLTMSNAWAGYHRIVDEARHADANRLGRKCRQRGRTIKRLQDKLSSGHAISKALADTRRLLRAKLPISRKLRMQLIGERAVAALGIEKDMDQTTELMVEAAQDAATMEFVTFPVLPIDPDADARVNQMVNEQVKGAAVKRSIAQRDVGGE